MNLSLHCTNKGLIFTLYRTINGDIYAAVRFVQVATVLFLLGMSSFLYFFQIKHLTGTKILRILRAKGLASKIPEDLYHLIKKAVAIRKHLEKNRQDKDSKYRLILIESRVHKLARYYKTKSVLPPNWKYESATASALVA